jgi:hypothetical protein
MVDIAWKTLMFCIICEVCVEQQYVGRVSVKPVSLLHNTLYATYYIVYIYMLAMNEGNQREAW